MARDRSAPLKTLIKVQKGIYWMYKVIWSNPGQSVLKNNLKWTLVYWRSQPLHCLYILLHHTMLNLRNYVLYSATKIKIITVTSSKRRTFKHLKVHVCKKILLHLNECCYQCDQIGWFITLWATFQSPWQQ